MTLLLEHWKPVVGWETLYAVSNTGRVWSNRTQKCLKLHESDGYLRVRLFSRQISHNFTVHAIVAAAFVGIRPLGLTVNHINGDKLNNWASNFEYLTRLDNSRHAVAMGLSNRGSRHGLAKLKEDDVRLMRANPAAKTIAGWAEHFGCHETNIARAIKGQSWRHV